MARKICILITCWLATGMVARSQSPAAPSVQNSQEQSGTREQKQSMNLSPKSLWERRMDKTLQYFGIQPDPAMEAKQAFAKQDYAKAVEKYAEAIRIAPQNAELHYNLALALHHLNKPSEALETWRKSLINADTALQAKSQFNIGNVWVDLAEKSEQSQPQMALQAYQSAAAHFKKSLELKKGYQEALRNLEIAQTRIQKLKEQLEKQQQQQQQNKENQKPPELSDEAREALARAMQLVNQRLYSDARDVLENIISRDPTAASLQQHVGRIDEVLTLLEPAEPE